MEQTDNKLGQKIKRFRLMNDIRQEDLADKMNVSRATLINYEKGHTAINFDVLNRLKKAFPAFEEQELSTKKQKIINNDNTIEIALIFRLIARSKKFIFFCTIISALLGLGSSFLFTKYYNAQITLYPAKKESMPALGQLQAFAANLGVNTDSDSEHLDISDVVKSRLIANKVLNKKWTSSKQSEINLISLWGFYNRPWYDFYSNFEIDSAIVFDQALKKLKEHISVSKDKITGLIRINSEFEDPYISANVANFIGDEVQNYIQRENSVQSTKEKLFIKDRLGIVKSELEDAEHKLKIFKERNRGYEDSPELFMVFSRLFRETEVKKEVYLTLQQQLELARIDEVKQKPVLHILDRAVPPTAKSSPNRLLFLLTFLIFGAITSSLTILFKY